MAQAATMRNPLLERLKRGSGVMARWPGVAGAAVVGAGLWYSYVNAVVSPSNNPLGFAAYILSMSSTVALLIFLPVLAANLTGTYRRSAEYELVCATPLPDAALVGACIGAVLYRARALTLLAMVLLPLATFVLLPWPRLFPLNSTVNGVNNWPGNIDVGRTLYLTLMLELAFYGLLRWMASLAVVVALWTRWVVAAGLAALLVAVPVWWAAAAAITSLTPATATGWALGWPAVLAAAPYALAWLTERWGWRWARAGMAMGV